MSQLEPDAVASRLVCFLLLVSSGRLAADDTLVLVVLCVPVSPKGGRAAGWRRASPLRLIARGHGLR